LLCPFLAQWFLPIRFLLIVSNFQFFLLNFSVFTAGMPRGYGKLILKPSLLYLNK